MRILVDHVEGGVTSGWLHARSVNDNVHLQGPFGSFTLIEPKAGELVFVAQGSGLAPFRAHLLELAEARHAGRIVLHVTALPEGGIPWIRELEALVPRLSGLMICRHDEVVLMSERVATDCASPAGRQVYLCGLKEMIRPLSHRLREASFTRDTLRTEAYD